MSMIHPNSLAATLDVLNEAFFHGRPLTQSQRTEAARWIAGRQGLPGSYADMFAPTEKDFAEGSRLFTGEKLRSGGGMGHLLGEEACRALVVLDAADEDVRSALERAKLGMMSRLAGHEAGGHTLGMYCCGTCTPALWRNLAAGGLEDAERLLTAGMKALKALRDDRGRWGHFPFYYTLLALSEIDLASALEEMRYAAPACVRSLRRSPKGDRFDARRRLLAERILERC